jgi:hypothetical protein
LSLSLQTLVYAKLGTCTVAPDLSESDAVQAAQLHRALQGGRLLSFVTVTLTALLIVMYTMKGVFPIADQSSKMGDALFFVSALVWVFTSIAYGTVLPGASVLSTFENADHTLLSGITAARSVQSAIALTSTTFWLQLVFIATIHIISFLRVRDQENADAASALAVDTKSDAAQPVVESKTTV